MVNVVIHVVTYVQHHMRCYPKKVI